MHLKLGKTIAMTEFKDLNPDFFFFLLTEYSYVKMKVLNNLLNTMTSRKLTIC